MNITHGSVRLYLIAMESNSETQRNTIALECPSGMAGNLFASALGACGVPDEVFSEIPSILGLHEAFTVQMENGVLDGVWDSEVPETTTGGSTLDMARVVREHLRGREAEEAARILEARWSLDCQMYAYGEAWCDTLFDACAASRGLSYLGWPKVLVVGPLPDGAAAHPLARTLLPTWVWTDRHYPVEVVTPTGASILQSQASQVAYLPAGMQHVADLSGNYCRRFDLPPISVYRS